jgi:hypothetical protein
MKLLSFFILILSATPSKAITWEQFWQPLNNGYYPNYYLRSRSVTCKRELYREEYISSDGISPGYVKRITEVERYPC